MKKLYIFLISLFGFVLSSAWTASAQNETPWGKLDIYSGFNEDTQTAVVIIMNPSDALTEAIVNQTHNIRTEVRCNGAAVTGTIPNVKTGALFLTFEHDCASEPKTGAFIWEENGSEKRLELRFGENDTDAATVIVPTESAEKSEGKKIQIDSDNGQRTLTFKRYVLSLWDMKVWIDGAYENIPMANGAPVKPFDIEAVCDGKTVASKASQYDKTENAFVFRADCVSDPSAIYVVYQKDGKSVREAIYGAASVSTPPLGGNSDYVFRNVDPSYRDAYDKLRESEPIANGTQNETVRTIQTIFNEFGFELPLTGGFYNQSLASLQTIEETFGMEKTNSLDAATLERILINLLYYRAAKNETSEEETFPNTPNFDELERNLNLGTEAGNHLYLKACGLQMAGAYYKAYQTFEESGSDDYEQRMDACAQDWPATGQIDRDPNFYGTNTSLTFRIGKDADTAVIIKILRRGVTVSTLFLGRGDTVTAYLAGDTQYQLKLGMGEKWYGIKDAFGPDGYYEVMTYEDGTDTVFLEAGGIYTLSINTTTTTEGDPVDSERVPYRDF